MISIKSNINEVLRFTDGLIKQQRFAVASALTATATELRSELYAEQKRVFDRPTPYTQRSMFVRKATPQKLVAEVILKDRLLSKTTRSPAQILGHQYEGGKRKRKQIEEYCERAGLLSANEYLVPSEGARLDQYGNMSKGQVAQLISQLRVGLDPLTYASKSTRSVRNQRKAGQVFWSRGGSLARGVWMRAGDSVVPVLMVERNINYRQRIDVKRIGDKVFGLQFEANLRTAWARAKATAR
jgi:hypothetical protein